MLAGGVQLLKVQPFSNVDAEPPVPFGSIDGARARRPPGGRDGMGLLGRTEACGTLRYLYPHTVPARVVQVCLLACMQVRWHERNGFLLPELVERVRPLSYVRITGP